MNALEALEELEEIKNYILALTYAKDLSEERGVDNHARVLNKIQEEYIKKHDELQNRLEKTQLTNIR